MTPTSAPRQHRDAGSHHRQQAGPPGPAGAPAGHSSSPAVVSLQREIGIALDASQPMAVRCSSLGKLHAAMASHQATRPVVAVAMLPLFLTSWPQLVACLWDTTTPQLAAAAAPLLGIVGALVASSRAAAAAADAAAAESSSAPAASAAPAPSTASALLGPPPPPASLLFDWLLPLLTGAVPLPTGAPAPLQLQVLLCRTLAYALQQLPSCNTTPPPTPTTTTPPEHKHEDAPAPGQQQETKSAGNVQEAAAADTSARTPTQPAAAQQPGGPAAGAASKGKLLIAPVPPVAAQQLQQHAAVVTRAVQQLLEAVSTPPELLGPLLHLLLEVIRLAHTVIAGGVLRDLLDLLLGWSLEPGLQAKDRQLIQHVLVALRPCWLEEPQLAAGVGSKLLTDMGRLLPPALPQRAPAAVPAAVVAAAAGAAGSVEDAGAPAVGQQPANNANPADMQEAVSEGSTGPAAMPDDGRGAADAASQPSSQEQEQIEQQRRQQQQQQDMKRLLALLSCLVAILKATVGIAGHQQLLGGAIEFVQLAHGRMCSMVAAADAADHAAYGSVWASAAASLATSVLALWEVVASGASSLARLLLEPGPGAQIDTAAAAADGENVDDANGIASISQAQGAAQPADDAAAAAALTGAVPAAAAAGAQDAGSGAAGSSVTHRTWALVLKTLQLPLLPAEGAIGLMGSMSGGLSWALGVSGGSSDSSSSSRVCDSDGPQKGVDHSSKPPQQQADGAARPSPESNEQKGGREQQQDLASLVPVDVPAELWAATQSFRCSSLSDVQAAAAAAYSMAALVADRLAQQAGCQADQPNSLAPVSQQPGLRTNLFMQAVLGEVSDLCSSLAEGAAAAATAVDTEAEAAGAGSQAAAAAAATPGDAAHTASCVMSTLVQAAEADNMQPAPRSGLTLPQQAAALQFDLVLLECWLSCSSTVSAQPPTEADSSTATALGATAAAGAPGAAQQAAAAIAVGRIMAAVVGQISQLLLSGAQQLLQQQHAQQGEFAAGLIVSDDLIEQLVAVLWALLGVAVGTSSTTLDAATQATPHLSEASQSTAVVVALLSCLEELLTSPVVAVHYQTAAVELLAEVLAQPAALHHQERGTQTADGSTSTHSALQQAVLVLAAAASSASAEVRAAATAVAGRAAHANLQWMLQQQADVPHAADLFVALLQLLSSRCWDVDAAIAEAAQASAMELMLPLHLLEACSGNSSTTGWEHSIETGLDSAAAAAGAGLGCKWKRSAALQPQQRAFKPLQLAQLFDLAYQASPSMLQRCAQRSAQDQQQQQPQRKFAVQTAVLYRLAQALPLLPQPPVGSSSSSSSGPMLRFEELSSAAVVSWLLTQEAARQFVSARMRTHLGNPTQSFGALERILQALLQQLQGDESPTAVQRAWQRQLLLQMQAAIPQQQPQQLQQGQGQQSEPQQLLQAPGAAAAAAAAAAGAPHRRGPLQQSQQQQQHGTGAAASPKAGTTAAAAVDQRLDCEAAVGSLLNFMYALEVNIQAATEGSLMRPTVSKSVMAFFAGNKKVCEDWLSRTREALLCVSAAAGAQQHIVFHGMSRLQELHGQLKALTGHSQAQQQALQQERERERDKSRKQGLPSSATAAAASAAAAAAISGLGSAHGTQPQPQDSLGQQQQQQRGKQGRHQQQQVRSGAPAAGDAALPEQRKLKARNAAADAEQAPPAAPGPTGNAAAAAAGIAGAGAGGLSAAEQLRLLQQQYQAALLQLAAPVLTTLVLLSDACVASCEPFVLLGLQQWVHQGFGAVWEAVSQFYALDLLSADTPEEDFGESFEADLEGLDSGKDAASAAVSSRQRPQDGGAAPSMLLLSWLPAAAAQAAGRYEEALQRYNSFLASEACSTGLGAAVQAWVHEQLAACYAAVADWQGLAELCNTQRQQKQQQGQGQDQQEVQSVLWAQHWYLAGAAGLQQLRSWCMPAAVSAQQGLNLGVAAVEHHLHERYRGSGNSRGGRGQRGGAARNDGAGYSNDASSSSVLAQLMHLDPQQACLPSSTPAGLAMLQAIAALQLCDSAPGNISSIAELPMHDAGAAPGSPRGRGGRARGRGRGGPHTDLQHSQNVPRASLAEQQQQVLACVRDEVQQQLWSAASNPLVVASAFSAGLSSGLGLSCAVDAGAVGRLQQLSLLQLLQGQLVQLLQALQQQQGQQTKAAAEQDGALQSTVRLLEYLQRWSGTAGSHCGRVVASLEEGLWAAALRQNGSLAGSVFGDVASATALVQCVSPGNSSLTNSSTARTARQLVIREALLACGSHGCGTAMQRLLQAATSFDGDNRSHQGQLQWLLLLDSKLQLQAAASTQTTATAVAAHLQVLQQPVLHLQDSSRRGGNTPCADKPPDDASSLAAAYLSLGAILQEAAGQSPLDELHAACPLLQQVQWSAVHAGSLGELQPSTELPCCMSLVGPAPSRPQCQPLQQAALACSAAAMAALPKHPAPWKAYGDLLFTLGNNTAAPLDAAADSQAMPDAPQLQHGDAAALFGAAAESYCMHLAALANSGGLTSPQQTLGVLVKLLQIILQHGDKLQQELTQALSACPAAVWQVLTNQLLAQLQHSSAAVRGIVQQLLQGLAVVVPCAVLYPLVVEVRAAQEAGQETPAELSVIVSQLQRVQPRMMADTVAMADALEALTVTRWEAWAGLLMELSLETNRKLLSLRADASRQDQQHLPPARRVELFNNRYNTVMSPVISSLQQHIAAATAHDARSPDDAAFRQQLLPQLLELLDVLRQPPDDLLKLAAGEQSDSDSDDAADDAPTPAPNSSRRQQAAGTTATSKDAAAGGVQSVDSGGWPLLKQLRQQLQQQLRRQQHLQLSSVAPQLSGLRNTAIPLPADDMTGDNLPALSLRAALDCLDTGLSDTAAAGGGSMPLPASSTPGATVLLMASGQAVPASHARLDSMSSSSSSWLCIAGFDKQVAVLPTKTRPKRLLMLASDGTIHAFLLKGRDDLRVDERLMQFMRASNALLAAEASTPLGRASTGPLPSAAAAAGVPAIAGASTAAAAAAVVGWREARTGSLRVRPYSITPFGRRAGLVQWVRHTTSLYGLFRSWQQAAAERYQAVAAAKRDAAATAAAAAAGGTAASGDKQATSAAVGAGGGGPGNADKGADAGSSSVPLPLIVAANRPTDAFYARLLPALQAAGLPVGSARSSWPASVLRSTFASLVRDVPRTLLARQLLSGAAEPGGWWCSQQTFTASAAAGSIVGWLLGLGDRHMDNLLLDRESCELVHIDFSVCFDKGASLAVPEVVPFRLTQMMQVALGPGSLAGPFSAAAARVLSTLRGASDLLGSLLQLLLSDSAVDWSVDREAHAARKDQDTAVGLRLCASRLEELRHPLLANLAAALPTIGNGLAAVVSYGEAHIFMLQLQSTAAAAHNRAAAAAAAVSEAAADEVRALTTGANAAKSVTSLTSDYRRLCGLAASCISSAGNWLGRHLETLAALGAVGGGSGSNSGGSGSGGLSLLLAVAQGDWDPALADRSLLLLTGNAGGREPASVDGSSCSSSGGVAASVGLLVSALRSFLPSGASGVAAGLEDGSSAAAAELHAMLPPELLQHCLELDSQGLMLLQQQQALVAQGRWSLCCYAAVLEQLLSGGDAYVHTSHHWAWSAAFQAAAAGPEVHSITAATATAPHIPTPQQVTATWAHLAACWGATRLTQQQHHQAAALAAAAQDLTAAEGSATQGMLDDAVQDDVGGGETRQLSAVLQQLAAKMHSSSIEADAAEVQYVASKALADVCTAAQAAATAAAALRGTGPPAETSQQAGTAVVAAAAAPATAHDELLSALQVQLAVLQGAMSEYEQSGLGYVLDPSTSTASAELLEAAADLEGLLDAGDDEQAAAVMHAQQQQQQPKQQWQQQLLTASTQLQLMSQLLVAIQYEALAPIAVWQMAAGDDDARDMTSSTSRDSAAVQQAQQQQEQQLVLLPAGPVSQQQLWHATAAHVGRHWQALQQLLSQAADLEGHMHALAAVAAVGGAAAIWPEDMDLMTQAIQLQQLLLPQGFDVLTTDECVASAQLLQAQWAEVEQMLWLECAACLCPLLGLQGGSEPTAQAQHSMQGHLGASTPTGSAQDAAAGLEVLQQLLDAAAAGTAGGSLMHCKDVLEALAVGSAAAAGSSSGSASRSVGSSMWGVPGMSDAWRALVVLLLQYSCLLQQVMQQRRQGGYTGGALADAGAGSGAVPGCGGTDVLRSSQALPLDVEAQRPLVMVVQALHELLCKQGVRLQAPPAPTGATTAAEDALNNSSSGNTPAAASSVCLQQQLQDILFPSLLQQVSLVLQQQLATLQQHLDALASEAGAALARLQGHHHQQQQQHVEKDDQVQGHGTTLQERDTLQWGAAGERAGGAGMGAGADGTLGDGLELVPFDAFDMSLAGADMMLEDLGGIECGGDDEGSDPASAAGWLEGSEQGTAEQEQLPELVPFDAFDEGLAGAGMVLEGGDGSGAGAGDNDGGGFFGALEAAGEADLLGGSLEGDHGQQQQQRWGAPDDDDADASQRGSSSQPAERSCEEARVLARQLMAAGVSAAAAALRQQQLAGLEQVQDSCIWQQQVWVRHLAAFEWLWGDLLQQGLLERSVGLQEEVLTGASSAAAALPSPLLQQQQRWLLEAAAAALNLPAVGNSSASDNVIAAGLAHPGDAYQQYCSALLPQLSPDPSGVQPQPQQLPQQQRMPTSTELLASWQGLCEQHAAVADALQAWRDGCAAAAAAVGDVLLGPAGDGLGSAAGLLQVSDPTVCRKMLSGAVARAGHWLSGAAGLCSSLSQQAEASLQLEYSRRGLLWAPGMPDGVDAFQGNTSLLQQLAAAATALTDAQAQGASAEALLASSQAAAVQAQLTIEEATAEAAAAEQQLALKTAAALARAQGMLPVLEPMVAAAEAALPIVTDGLGTTLRALTSLVERNSAARDLAPVVKSVCLQHGRCLRVLQRLHDIGAGCAGGLMAVVQDMQHWMQQQGLQGQREAAALFVSTDTVRDAQLLQLLLTHLQPALAGVKEELSELGQAHVLFTHLTEQLDSLAASAETVASAITSDHAMQTPAAGQGRFMPAGSSSTGRKQRAEARQRAFAAAALARCTARLTGQRLAKAATGPNQAAEQQPAGASAQQAQPGAGRSGGSSKSVVDEVAALVAAATSVDKLSRMYEGWAAWL